MNNILGNRYELIEKVGEGGMAEVYKAKCKLLNRFVAVKILKDEYSNNTEFVNKFNREASAVASLSHNNIVNIYDVGSENNINYIVMEFVKGKTLKQIIKEKGKLKCSEAINIAIQISKALECAHKNNIIHRDIKPHNILVTDENLVKVTDFGIAKASNSVTIINTTKVVGSAHYFSPEQARGSIVDARTDIYSLGVVLYEMVTGRVPYDGETPVSLALKHIQEPLTPPQKINPDIPNSLNNLILKAMEKDPISRYQTAKEMLSDLEMLKKDYNYTILNTSIDNEYTRIMDPIKLEDFDDDDKDFEDDQDYEEDNKASRKKGKGNSINSKTKKNILISILAVLVLSLGAISGYFFMSSGSNASVTVPNIIGLKEDEARKLLESKKLSFVPSERVKSEKPEGTVLRCYPDVNTKVKIKTPIRATISAGHKGLTMPNLKGIDLKSAQEILRNYGLELGDVSYDYSNSVAEGSIISQNPEIDSNINKGDRVDFVVSKGSREQGVEVPNLIGEDMINVDGILNKNNLRVGETKAVFTDNKKLDGKVKSQSPVGGKVRKNSKVNITYYKFTKEQA